MNKAELIKALAELLADKMEIGEEPTNGEIIQALFPNTQTRESYYSLNFIEYTFDGVAGNIVEKKWWNAPYQKGSE